MLAHPWTELGANDKYQEKVAPSMTMGIILVYNIHFSWLYHTKPWRSLKFCSLSIRESINPIKVWLPINWPIQWHELGTKMLPNSFDNHISIHQQLAIHLRIYLHLQCNLWLNLLLISCLIVRSLHIQVLGLRIVGVQLGICCLSWCILVLGLWTHMLIYICICWSCHNDYWWLPSIWHIIVVNRSRIWCSHSITIIWGYIYTPIYPITAHYKWIVGCIPCVPI